MSSAAALADADGSAAPPVAVGTALPACAAADVVRVGLVGRVEGDAVLQRRLVELLGLRCIVAEPVPPGSDDVGIAAAMELPFVLRVGSRMLEHTSRASVVVGQMKMYRAALEATLVAVADRRVVVTIARHEATMGIDPGRALERAMPGSDGTVPRGHPLVDVIDAVVAAVRAPGRRPGANGDGAADPAAPGPVAPSGDVRCARLAGRRLGVVRRGGTTSVLEGRLLQELTHRCVAVFELAPVDDEVAAARAAGLDALVRWSTKLDAVGPPEGDFGLRPYVASVVVKVVGVADRAVLLSWSRAWNLTGPDVDVALDDQAGKSARMPTAKRPIADEVVDAVTDALTRAPPLR